MDASGPALMGRCSAPGSHTIAFRCLCLAFICIPPSLQWSSSHALETGIMVSLYSLQVLLKNKRFVVNCCCDKNTV